MIYNYWLSNLPSIEINVNTPIEFVKNWIQLTVRLPLQVGLLQQDVVTESQLISTSTHQDANSPQDLHCDS